MKGAGCRQVERLGEFVGAVVRLVLHDADEPTDARIIAVGRDQFLLGAGRPFPFGRNLVHRPFDDGHA